MTFQIVKSYYSLHMDRSYGMKIYTYFPRTHLKELTITVKWVNRHKYEEVWKISLYEQLVTYIEEIKGQRHQFLLLSFQTNNESKLFAVLQEIGATTVNLNLLLANKISKLPISKRKRAVKDVLREAMNGVQSDIVFFDRIEYLFDEELNQDPLRLFEYLSGNKVLLIRWPGDISGNRLVYATPDHPEYYQIDGYQDHLAII